MTQELVQKEILVRERVRKIASKNPGALDNAYAEAKSMSDGRVKTKDNIIIKKIANFIVLL